MIANRKLNYCRKWEISGRADSDFHKYRNPVNISYLDILYLAEAFGNTQAVKLLDSDRF